MPARRRASIQRWTTVMPPASRPTVLETVFVRGAVRIPVWSVEELIRGGTGGPAAGGARDAA